MVLNKIYNEDCLELIPKIDDGLLDLVMTSPPYNTSRDGGSLEDSSTRYLKDTFSDEKTQDEYIEWCINIFNALEPKIKPNGVIVWNVSYGSDTTGNEGNNDTMWLCIADLIRNTPFTVADRIVWKKPTSTPNPNSPNRLDRICEDVFVFCRKEELKTFHANKKVSSVRATGQKMYSTIRNFIEAPCNSEVCDINKATYSVELCNAIFKIYAPKNAVIYDPFMGSGTTAIACIENGHKYIGSEISKAQMDWAENRIKKYRGNSLWFK